MFCEVDIVLDGDMPLWEAHDIGQALQDDLEALPDVDRCFVHIDHEVEHKPGEFCFPADSIESISILTILLAVWL